MNRIWRAIKFSFDVASTGEKIMVELVIVLGIATIIAVMLDYK
jgi:hypothetical protein